MDKTAHPSRRIGTLLLFILVLAFVLRLPLVLQPQVIQNDGIGYLYHAKEISAGNWMGGKSPPVYPALISFAHLFISSYESAGIWVSMIFGILLILPVFYLGKVIFNERVGILSALFALVHPTFFVFSGSVLTESLYFFLLATCVYFGWGAFNHARVRDIILFGLFSASLYLTRPEGIGLIIVFSFWVLLVNPAGGKRPWIKRVGIFLAAAFCFLALSSPYLIQMKKESGKWELSKKSSINVEASSKNKTEAVVERGGGKIVFNVGTFLRNPLPLFRKFSLGFLTALYRFQQQQAYHPLLFILAIFGWIGILRNRSSNKLKGNVYIFSHHVFYFGLVFPFFWILRRYTSQMVPVSIPWAAFGGLILMDWASRWFPDESRREKLSTILLIAVMCIFYAQGNIVHFREHRWMQKEAGVWMKENLPLGGKMMSRLPQEAFYAEMEWTGIPQGHYGNILKTARSNKDQYLVIDEKIDELSPGFYKANREKDLILIKKLMDGNEQVLIFKIIYPEWSPTG